MNGITCEKDAQRAQTIYNELTVSNFLFVGEDSTPIHSRTMSLQSLFPELDQSNRSRRVANYVFVLEMVVLELFVRCSVGK